MGTLGWSQSGIGTTIGLRTLIDDDFGQPGAVTMTADSGVAMRLLREQRMHGKEAHTTQPPSDHVYVVVGARRRGKQLPRATLRQGVRVCAKGS